MLDFRIHTFLMVCETMNFTAAAEKLNLTQPAVTQHIHFLEEQYQCALFNREGRRLSLTPAGLTLQRAMETLRNDEHKLLRELQPVPSSQLLLNFGVTMTIGEYAIIQPVAFYLKLHPETDIQIHYANTQTLLAKLRAGSIDFAIVEGYIRENEFETRTYQTADFIPICHINHRFRQKPQVLKDLFPERLLVRETGSGTRSILENALALEGYHISDFAHILQVENMHAIISFLKEDCGISFLYETAAADEITNGTLRRIPLEDFHLKHDYTFLWNKGSIYSPQMEEIFSALQL